MQIPIINASLTTKLSLLVTATVLLTLLILGFYFDSFLQQSFLNSTQKRIQHGFVRLALNLRNIERELSAGISFVRDDERMKASIALINNYQDKNNYNTYLIDEEKKAIAEELWNRVKLSFNRDIALYDQNQELVAFAVKQASGYDLYFVSFAGGQRKLFTRSEQQSEYIQVPFSLPRGISPTHTSYYADESVFNESFVTYHRIADDLAIKSHQDLVEEPDEHIIGHIEMSRYLDAAWFEHLSNDLDLDMNFAFGSVEQFNAQKLDATSGLPLVEVQQTDTSYIGLLSKEIQKDHVYFVTRLDKHAVQAVLNQNRIQFFLLLILVATSTLLLMRLLLRVGLAHPLTALMMQVKRIEQHDYATTASVITGDELQSISTSINQLAQTVREREESLEQSRKELQNLSNHDSLTELPNRRYFSARLQQALEQAKQQDEMLALLFLDLDQFKLVNDTLGHEVGDQLLIKVARRLRRELRDTDFLARIGGDEFMILVEVPKTLHDLEYLVTHYLALFHHPFRCANNEISTTTSIGISLFPRDGQDMVTLIKNADLAMYRAKDAGRNNFSFYSSELSDEVRERTEMIHALQTALAAGDQFELYYQPKLSVSSGAIETVEALIRWHSPDYGFLLPDRFIPLTEETGLIVPLGEWLLQQGCLDFAYLKRLGIKLKQISINLSSVQMSHTDIIRMVHQIIERTGISPEELELEITESYIATNIDEAISTLQKFRSMGVHLAVDDFGTGYSSMSYLQKLPVTRIKVDKSFVDGLPQDHDSVAITRAIVGLAKNFGLAITAEGVENKAQLDFLEEEACDEIQGYYFAKPMSLQELITFCHSHATDNNVILLDTRRDK